jgi:ATPase subunit of ABC transporter with duplicated ATPase domains
MYKLEVQDLHKRYGSHEVLKGVSLKAAAGDVISIIGSSGSGKSTFLRCINLLEQPHAGKILLNNEELKLVAKGRRAQGRRSETAATHAFAPVDGVPAFQPVVAHDRAGKHHGSAGARAGRVQGRSAGKSRALPEQSGRGSPQDAYPGICPAASSSAWRLPVRWRWSRK